MIRECAFEIMKNVNAVASARPTDIPCCWPRGRKDSSGPQDEEDGASAPGAIQARNATGAMCWYVFGSSTSRGWPR